MRERGDRFGFPLEASEPIGITRKGSGQNLDGDEAEARAGGSEEDASGGGNAQRPLL